MELNELAYSLENATGPETWMNIAIGRLLDDDRLHDYVSSLDAAVALCERVLPGVVWIVRGNADLVRGHKAEAYLSRFAIDRFRDVGNPESHFTPALALCLAVVRAKLAEPE